MLPELHSRDAACFKRISRLVRIAHIDMNDSVIFHVSKAVDEALSNTWWRNVSFTNVAINDIVSDIDLGG